MSQSFRTENILHMPYQISVRDVQYMLGLLCSYALPWSHEHLPEWTQTLVGSDTIFYVHINEVPLHILTNIGTKLHYELKSSSQGRNMH